MAAKPGKVTSFAGAEYISEDDLQWWRAEVLEEFFRQRPEAFEELKGRMTAEIKALRVTALLAAHDESFREELLQCYHVRERNAVLAVFTCFPRINEGHTNHRITATHLRLCEGDYLPDLQPFRDAFLSWLRRYNLDADWVADALLDWLRDFERHPELYRDGYHGDRDRAGWVVKSPAFHFEYRGFELTGERWDDYRREIENAFRQAVAEHLKGIEEQAKQRGLTRARKAEPEHFKWLVMRLAGRTNADIAEEFGRSETSVSDAVVEKARAIGIELPKSTHHSKPRRRRSR